MKNVSIINMILSLSIVSIIVGYIAEKSVIQSYDFEASNPVINREDAQLVNQGLTSLPKNVTSIRLVSDTENSSIKLSWVDNSNSETGFKISRQGNNGQWLAIAKLETNTQEYQDFKVTPGAQYTYRVAAFNAKGESFSMISQSIEISGFNGHVSAAR